MDSGGGPFLQPRSNKVRASSNSTSRGQTTPSPRFCFFLSQPLSAPASQPFNHCLPYNPTHRTSNMDEAAMNHLASTTFPLIHGKDESEDLAGHVFSTLHLSSTHSPLLNCECNALPPTDMLTNCPFFSPPPTYKYIAKCLSFKKA